MSAVKGFIAAFSGGCVFLGALYILVPEGKLSKAVKYTVSLCFLCVILSAATVSCNASFPEFTVKEGDFDSERLSADSARLVFEGALTSAGINFSKITVFTDKTEDGSINIIEVYVYTDASSEAVAAVIGSGSYKLVVVNG